MQASNGPDTRTDDGRIRRSYRALLAATIILAAVGAPIFMRGAVILAESVTASTASGAPSRAIWGLGVFALSTTPLALAGYTWKRTHGFQDDPEHK